MIVKRSYKCMECKKFIDVYIEEGSDIRKQVIKCKHCNSKQKCISINNYIEKWRKVI